LDRAEIHVELERVQRTFQQLASRASADDLRRLSRGTRWTNRQLLFHMVFGYLIVRTLMPLVRTLGRRGWGRGFAVILNAVRSPFHLINYLGSVGGGHLLTPQAMTKLLDRTMQALHRNLDRETARTLTLTMHFPTDWDPYFRPTMSVLDVYHYGTQHFDHHRHQLTL
jgi:hypothetical protein